MHAGEPPRTWSDFDIRQLVGSNLMHPIVTLEQQTVAQESTRRVELDRVRNVATGDESQVIRIVSADAAHYASVIVPVLLDGRLMLLGRYRHAIDRWSIELPRFASVTRDTGWKHTAESQLRKTIGLKSTKMTLLGAVQPDPAWAATHAIVVLAEGCVVHAARGVNPRELIAGAVALAPDELNRLVRRGEIVCGVSLAALYMYGAHSRT
ncbi:MAG: NUDIX hydrolase [Pirellulales bacterium]